MIVGAGISAAQVAAALVGCRRASLVIERQRDIVTVMGFGGNGITFSQIASELVASRLDGRTDGDFDLFRFNPPPAPRKAA